MKTGRQKMETGSWKIEPSNRKIELGSRKVDPGSMVSGTGPAMEEQYPEHWVAFHRIPGGTLGPNYNRYHI